jgi:hypothetical protein
MQKKYWLLIIIGLGIMFGTTRAYGYCQYLDENGDEQWSEVGCVRAWNNAHPGTEYESGGVSQVLIYGAAKKGQISVMFFHDGWYQGWTNWDMTDDDVNYESTPSPISNDWDIGTWTTLWFVNNQQLTSANMDNKYFPHAPKLPTFKVYSSNVGDMIPKNEIDDVTCCNRDTNTCEEVNSSLGS